MTKCQCATRNHQGKMSLYILHIHFCIELENVFIKHYAPNHMPDPKEDSI